MCRLKVCFLWLLHIGRENACRATKCNAVANKLTIPKVFIGYRWSPKDNREAQSLSRFLIDSVIFSTDSLLGL